MVLTILFILKIILFIKMTGIQYNQAIIFTVSALFALFAFTLIYFSRNKKKQSIAFSFYNIMSAIMFADAVYYHYFNNLPSLIMLKQLGSVAQVGDSVRAVINPLHLLFLVDIPFLCVYSSKKKKKIKKSAKVYEKKIRIGIPSLLALTLAIVITVLSVGGYGTVLGRQELFTYHAKDFVSLFKSEDAKGEGEFTEEDLAHLRKRAMVDNGKLTGIGKGKNLLVIQVEGLQNFVINEYYDGQEVTPNLNSFIKDNSSIYFDRYYQLLGRGNTSDAEFVSNNSLYPSMEDPTYTQYQDITFCGLPWILRDNGYTSWVLHGYKPEFWNRSAAYPNQGFERFISEENYNVGEVIALGLNDKDFFKQSLPYLKEMEKPFHAFMITLSSHTPFTMPEKYHVIKLRPEHKDTMFGNYLQAIHYTDEAIGEFIEDLKKEGLYDDTVIAIYGDHFALSSMDEANEKIMTDYLGYQYDYDSMMNIPLIIHVPGEEINETVSKVSCQLDFLPTILNIMGVKNEKGVMFGKDILNTEDSFVAQQTYMLKGSFIDNEKVFVMSRDGVYKRSRAYYLDTRELVDLEKCKENYNRAIEEINKSNYVLRQGGRFSLSHLSGKDSTKLVAHAGGKIRGLTYTNSRESLDKSYKKGLRLLEVDFIWTTDNKLVCLHSWDGFVNKFFNVPVKQYSYDEFANFKMIHGWQQLTPDILAEWMEKHPDAYIVTDIKGDNVEGLRILKEEYPHIQDRIIPQIYHMEEYEPIANMGYKNIIYTLYLSSKVSDEEILEFARENELFAITMPEKRAEGTLPNLLKKEGILTYTHTINDKKTKKKLEQNGVYGFYTDELRQ